MKILVKSDDYGFTKATTLGTLDGIENGIITCTGLFTNMPDSQYAADAIKWLPQACLGVDFNIASGHCVADPKLIGNLVDENGYFIRSTVKYTDPLYQTDQRAELWPYAECLIEIKAQLAQFEQLTGRMPEYLNGHSISAVATHFTKAISDVAKETGIRYSKEVFDQYGFHSMSAVRNQKPLLVETQLATDVEQRMMDHIAEYQSNEYVSVGIHCGFVDAEIFKWSTFSIIRAKDHAMVTSPRVKAWIAANAELISFRDLP